MIKKTYEGLFNIQRVKSKLSGLLLNWGWISLDIMEPLEIRIFKYVFNIPVDRYLPIPIKLFIHSSPARRAGLVFYPGTNFESM